MGEDKSCWGRKVDTKNEQGGRGRGTVVGRRRDCSEEEEII